jgi:hypothetical protein
MVAGRWFKTATCHENDSGMQKGFPTECQADTILREVPLKQSEHFRGTIHVKSFRSSHSAGIMNSAFLLDMLTQEVRLTTRAVRMRSGKVSRLWH